MPEALTASHAFPTPTTDPADPVDRAGSVTLPATADCTTSASVEPTPGPGWILIVKDLQIASERHHRGTLRELIILDPHIGYQPTREPTGPTRSPDNGHWRTAIAGPAGSDVLRHRFCGAEGDSNPDLLICEEAAPRLGDP
jgi:hypothetical protein